MDKKSNLNIGGGGHMRDSTTRNQSTPGGHTEILSSQGSTTSTQYLSTQCSERRHRLLLWRI